MRDIQWDERDRYSRMENDMRSMRVHINVEFRLRRDIAMFQDRPAHNDEFLHCLGKARLLADGHRYVRQWSDGEDADLTRLGKDTFDQIIDSMLRERIR